jgi:hypothetical protein
VIGTNVQAYNARLSSIAGLTPASSLIIGNGLGGYEMVTPANFITNNNILDTGDIGVSVQAYNATLASVAGGTYTGDDSIVTIGTLSSGAVPASLVTAGTFPSGAYVFQGAVSGVTTLGLSGLLTTSKGITASATGQLAGVPAFWFHNATNLADTDGVVISTVNNGADAEVLHVRTNNTTYANGTSLFLIKGDGSVTGTGDWSVTGAMSATTTISAPRINGSTGTGTLLLYGDSAATIPLTVHDTGNVSINSNAFLWDSVSNILNITSANDIPLRVISTDAQAALRLQDTSGSVDLTYTGSTNVLGIGAVKFSTTGTASTGALTVTGTGTFAGNITANSATARIQANSTGTNPAYHEWTNPAGSVRAGIDRLSGGGLFVGGNSSAYAAVFGHRGAYSTILYTNDIGRYEITSAGNHDFKSGTITTTGTLASGALTVTGLASSTTAKVNIGNVNTPTGIQLLSDSATGNSGRFLFGATTDVGYDFAIFKSGLAGASTLSFRYGATVSVSSGTEVLSLASTGATVTGTGFFQNTGSTSVVSIFSTTNVLNEYATLRFGTVPGSRTKAEIRAVNTNTGNAAGGLELYTNNGAALIKQIDLVYNGGISLLYNTTVTGTLASGVLTASGGLNVTGVSGVNAVTITANAAGGGRIIQLKDGGTPTKYNWIFGAQQNVDNGFEITPSTAAGGSTFSTPALRIAATTGAVTIASTLASGALTVTGASILNGAVSGITTLSVTGNSTVKDLKLTNATSSIDVGTSTNATTVLDFDFPDISTATGAIRVFRNTNTSGTRDFTIYKGNGTGTSVFSVSAASSTVATGALTVTGTGVFTSSDASSYGLRLIGTSTGGAYFYITENAVKTWAIGIDDGGNSLKFRENSITGDTALELDVNSNAIFAAAVEVGTYLQGTTTNGYLDLRGDSGATSGVRIQDDGFVAVGHTAAGRLLHLHATTNTDVHLTNGATGALSTDGGTITMASLDLLVNNREAGTVKIYTTGTERVQVPALGGLVIGTAAIATTATDGFLYIPSCAGAPTGTPTSKTGRTPMVFDTTNNKLMIYDGGWIGVTLS